MKLDPAVVGQLHELGGEALVHKLFRTFVDHAPVRREDLRTAAESRDAEALARAVHSMRSSSAMLGARELSALAGELEELADDGRLDALLARLPELDAELEAMLERLAAELEAASPEG